MPTTLLADRIISSTELNRTPGEFLARALDGPITVTNKNGDCVILAREFAAKLFQEEHNLQYLMGLADYILVRFCGVAHTAHSREFDWLDRFEKEEVLEFYKEYCETLRNPAAAPVDLENVIHEWQESALALQNEELLRVVESTKKR